jgi:glycine/D-amino acid oxidase-like deaminating enzyme
VDAVVVGAGITGAMIADRLADAGLKVAIVDKRKPATGATTASTALVQYEIDTPLIQLSRKIGKADAIRAWRRSRLAADALAARLDELRVAGVTRRNSLYLAGNVLNKEELAREYEQRRSAGFSSRYLDRKSLHERFGLKRSAAILEFDNVTIDPRKTTAALLQAAISNKAKVFAPVEVVNIDAKRTGAVVTAADGKQIDCRHLVLATGYEFPRCVPLRGHKILSTWAIATIPQPRQLWPEQCTIWEASDPYLYLRTTSDGRVICGGEDEDIADAQKRDALLKRKSAVLARKLQRLLPRINPTIEFAWTGMFGETASGLPTIDRIPRMPNCWVALGYGGNGITYARIAADVISSAVVGRSDVDADLYQFPA